MPPISPEMVELLPTASEPGFAERCWTDDGVTHRCQRRARGKSEFERALTDVLARRAARLRTALAAAARERQAKAQEYGGKNRRRRQFSALASREHPFDFESAARAPRISFAFLQAEGPAADAEFRRAMCKMRGRPPPISGDRPPDFSGGHGGDQRTDPGAPSTAQRGARQESVTQDVAPLLHRVD